MKHDFSALLMENFGFLDILVIIYLGGRLFVWLSIVLLAVVRSHFF